ncbi:MAG: hypothetical protein R6U57_09235 [Anaerolineales bacterium]
MKKERGLLIVSLFAVLLLAMVSSVSAEPQGPIKCDIPLMIKVHDPDDYPFIPPPYPAWIGPIEGCEIKGYIVFTHDPEYPMADFAEPGPPPPPVLVGNTYHFYELFTIYSLEGDPVIQGKDKGVLTFSNWRFHSVGAVTDTSPEWEHLMGSQYFSKGALDSPGLTLPGFASDTTMKITPGK